MNDTIWKDIKGYEKRYEVSNDGNIRNKNTKKILKQFLKHDYYSVNLYYDTSKSKGHLVHRIVAKNFIKNNNPKFDKVDHIDNNKLNNNVKNLRWVDQSTNINSFNLNYKKELIKPILQYDLDMNFVKKLKRVTE